MKKFLILLIPAFLVAVKPCGLEEPFQEQIEQIVAQEKEILSQENLVPMGMSQELLSIANAQVYAIGLYGSTLTLSDFSLWVVKPSDGQTIAGWPGAWEEEEYGTTPAEVYLTTNNAYFFGTEWKYRVVNIVTEESALINISQSPSLECTNIIYGIDHEEGRIEVMTPRGASAVFHFSSYDKATYENWDVGQRIILGRNSNWNSRWSPFLLINIDTLNHARASLQYF